MEKPTTKKVAKVEDKAVKFKVGNIIIEKGKKYILDHKFDGSAPSGLKTIEATRLPFDMNVLKDCVYFDENKNQYDTGFYPQSLCLSRYSQSERDELVPIYIKEIKEPYEYAQNAELAQNENNKFYKDYRFELYVNKEFDTTNPIDMFDLFNALMQSTVCAKDERDPHYAHTAKFNLSNPSDVKNKAKDKTKRKRTAFDKFSIMVDGDREKLDIVLEYIGRDNPSKVSDDDLRDLYFDIINDKNNGMDFVDRFLEASAKYATPIGKEEMEYFALAKRLYKANQIKKTKKGFTTISEDQFLGTTLQAVATFCTIKDSIQQKIIEELADNLN